MIENDSQLDQARQALLDLEDALRALRNRVSPANPALFLAMAEDYRANIAAIRSEIDRYLGLEAVGDQGAPLWMVLEGRAISGRDISSRLLSDWLDRFRKSLYGVTAFLETGLMRFGERPNANILAATDAHVVALAPGSIRVGLRLPEVEPTTESNALPEGPSDTAARALEALLSVAALASSGSAEQLVTAGGDRDLLSVAARFAAKLAPSQRSVVRTVTFSGALVPQKTALRLTAESKTKLTGLVKLLSRVSEETVRGQIREIDLDQRRITLRERGPGLPDLKCIIPDSLMERVEQLLDKQVVVRGWISSATPDTMTVQAISPDNDSNKT